MEKVDKKIMGGYQPQTRCISSDYDKNTCKVSKRLVKNVRGLRPKTTHLIVSTDGQKDGQKDWQTVLQQFGFRGYLSHCKFPQGFKGYKLPNRKVYNVS